MKIYLIFCCKKHIICQNELNIIRLLLGATLAHLPLSSVSSFKRFPTEITRDPTNPDLLHKQRDHLNVNQSKAFDQSIQSVLSTCHKLVQYCSTQKDFTFYNYR